MYHPIRPTQPFVWTRSQPRTLVMVDSKTFLDAIQRTTIKILDVMATPMTSFVINPGRTTNRFASYLEETFI